MAQPKVRGGRILPAEKARWRMPLGCRILMGIGLGMIVGCWSYMLRHPDHIGALMGLWFPATLTGLALAGASLLIGWARRPKPVRLK